MMRWKNCGLGASTSGVIAALLAACMVSAIAQSPKVGDPPEAENMRLVGYNDLQARSAYQPTVQRQGDRYILYVGHHGGSRREAKPLNGLTGQREFNGTSILDVTDPAHPALLAQASTLRNSNDFHARSCPTARTSGWLCVALCRSGVPS